MSNSVAIFARAFYSCDIQNTQIIHLDIVKKKEKKERKGTKKINSRYPLAKSNFCKVFEITA